MHFIIPNRKLAKLSQTVEKIPDRSIPYSTPLLLSKNKADILCSQKAFRQQLYSQGVQNCADRYVSLTKVIFRLPLNIPSAVLQVRKKAERQIHSGGRD